MTGLAVNLEPSDVRRLEVLAEVAGETREVYLRSLVARALEYRWTALRELANPPTPTPTPAPHAFPLPKQSAPTRSADPPKPKAKRAAERPRQAPTKRGGWRRRSPVMMERDHRNIVDLLCSTGKPLTVAEMAHRLGRQERHVFMDCNALRKAGLLVRAGGRGHRNTYAPAPNGSQTGGAA